ncbi:uncharacterized protein LOC110848842 isoform X2 [Folsomia candida]|uniref:uncharacterized protein LOC110848842 isoform X2 n=1 Tax=Folsomia candida TaxID=158441 RepID=UPI000B90105E|nr:uncharacterized protein LOC110848842 isoform X2 [Folsomia candida]
MVKYSHFSESEFTTYVCGKSSFSTTTSHTTTATTLIFFCYILYVSFVWVRMEGDESFSDDDGFVTTQKRTMRRATPKMVEKKAKLVKAGPSTDAAKSKPSTAKTATPDPTKHLAVETTRAANCAEGELNPRGTKDKEKRKSETATSLAREDRTFQPVHWSYISDEEEMEVEEKEMRPRDGRGIIYRDGDLAEEFQIRYVASSDVRSGTTVKDEGVDKIRKTILRLVGLAPIETNSPDHNVFEASPQLVLTQEEQGLTPEQREVLLSGDFPQRRSCWRR